MYYYASAALPMLFFSEKPLITTEEFLTFCSEQLSSGDYVVMLQSSLEIGNEKAIENPILEKWRTWETSLRNELASIRAQQLQKDREEHMREGIEVIGMDDLVKNALAGDNPLETEKKFYESRWNYLEELGTNIFFTLDSLIVYYLKLQLLEKLFQFDPEAGEENFNTVYTRIREGTDQEEDIEIERNTGVNP